MEKRYMKQAMDEARFGIEQEHGGPFGAIVVDKNGKSIGKGHNMVLVLQDPTAHAEITAIRDACKNIGSYDLKDTTLYTTCYPCPMCMGAILWANIGKVYYGCTGGDAAKIGFSDDRYRAFFGDSKRQRELLARDRESRGECKKLFDEYEKRNGVRYNGNAD
jgi:tRNA(Arg) A34 adenosine deaminase TadA